LDEREARLAARERAVLAAEADLPAADEPAARAAPAATAESSPHLIAKLTMAPFAMGRSLLNRPKAKA
jgi:hypothetical protein